MSEKEIIELLKECISKDLYFEINPEKAKVLDTYIEELKEQLQIKDEGFKASTEELCEYAEINELKNQQIEIIKEILAKYKEIMTDRDYLDKLK